MNWCFARALCREVTFDASQEHYIERLLKKFGHQDVNPVSITYDVNTLLMKNKGDTIGQSRYAHITGSLI